MHIDAHTWNYYRFYALFAVKCIVYFLGMDHNAEQSGIDVLVLPLLVIRDAFVWFYKMLFFSIRLLLLIIFFHICLIFGQLFVQIA